MANTLKVKRSAVASRVPTTNDLELGEIGINTWDGKVYIKRDNGTASIVEVTGGGGGGGASNLNDLTDVTITSATTNDILKYNGTAWVNSASLAASQVTGLATVATTGVYTDLTGLPTIPTTLAALTGDVTITSPSADQLLKYDGTKWVNATVAAGATSLDGLTDVAITSAAKGQLIAHDGTQFINTRTLEANAAATVPLTIKGATSQSGNLLNLQNSLSTNLVTVDSGGRVTCAGGGWNSTALAVTGAMANNPTFASEGLYVGVDGGYTKMLLTGGNTGLIDFCATNNNANWKCRLWGNYILTIGTSNAAGTSRGYPAWFGGYEAAFPGLTVQSLATGCKTLVAKAIASQTANILELQNSSGTAMLSVSASGAVSQAVDGNTLGSATVTTTAAATKALVVKGAASQSANIMEVQNSSSTALVSVASTGAINVSSGSATPLTTTSSGGTSAEFKSSAGYNGFRVGCDSSTGVPYVALDTNSSQKGYFAYWGDTANRVSLGHSSSTDVINYFNGGTYSDRVGIKTATPDGQLGVACSSSSNKGLVVKGAASQSANLLELQDSSGNPMASVTAAGTMTVAGNLVVNGTTFTVNSTVTTVDDPIITLGGDTAPSVDDNKDRGIEFRWHNGTAAKTGFFGLDDSSGKFTFIPDGTNTSEVYTGDAGGAVFSTVESTVATGTAPLTVASTTRVTNLNADTVDGYHATDILMPSGAITAYGGSSAPSGWLLCDGTAVSRTTYAALFAVLGTTYGAGDGSTTFAVPNLQQRFPLGKAAAGTGSTLGGTGGAIDHTHTVPAHYHGMGSGADLNITSSGATTTTTDGAHTHTIQARESSTASTAASLMRGSATGTTNNTSTLSDGSHSHTVNAHTHASGSFAGRIGLVTGGVNGNAEMTSGTSNPPFLVVNYIIKT